MTTSATDQAQGSFFPDEDQKDLSGYWHRQVIGYLGAILPGLLLIINWRRLVGLPSWPPLNSVSTYYHTGAVVAFVGILYALAVYLFTYQGYRNEFRRRDRTLAIIAGCAAIIVAFFPTAAPNEELKPPWLTDGSEVIHKIAAAVLFGAFIFFCILQFPKTDTEKGRPLPPDKRMRNAVYYFCGAAMAVCILLVVILSVRNASIFWPEALALEFFALSWLVKGRVDWTAVTAAKRTLYYGLHPGQLVRKAWSAVRG